MGMPKSICFTNMRFSIGQRHFLTMVFTAMPAWSFVKDGVGSRLLGGSLSDDATQPPLFGSTTRFDLLNFLRKGLHLRQTVFEVAANSCFCNSRAGERPLLQRHRDQPGVKSCVPGERRRTDRLRSSFENRDVFDRGQLCRDNVHHITTANWKK